MPIIEGVGDEVLCLAVLAASVFVLFSGLLWEHALNLVGHVRNVPQVVFRGIQNIFGYNLGSGSSRISSEGQQFRARMNSPPENDCCSVCHDNFNMPCQANCSHWFCGQCILRVWDHGNALQPCRCPICRRPINLLIPCESVIHHREDPEAESILQRIGQYNRMCGSGSVGFLQRLQDTPLLLRRLLREFMDPQRALPLVIRARIFFSMVLLAVYVFSPVDIVPEGIFGIVGLLDDLVVILLVLFKLASWYRSFLFTRYSGRL